MPTTKKKSSGNRGPALRTLLFDEYGNYVTMVVEEDIKLIDAVLTFIEEGAGVRLTADDPFVVATATELHVERWFSHSKQQKYDECVDDPECDWWGPNGDGSRWCHVVSFGRTADAMLELARDGARGSERTNTELIAEARQLHPKPRELVLELADRLEASETFWSVDHGDRHHVRCHAYLVRSPQKYMARVRGVDEWTSEVNENGEVVKWAGYRHDDGSTFIIERTGVRDG